MEKNITNEEKVLIFNKLQKDLKYRFQACPFMFYNEHTDKESYEKLNPLITEWLNSINSHTFGNNFNRDQWNKNLCETLSITNNSENNEKIKRILINHIWKIANVSSNAIADAGFSRLWFNIMKNKDLYTIQEALEIIYVKKNHTKNIIKKLTEIGIKKYINFFNKDLELILKFKYILEIFYDILKYCSVEEHENIGLLGKLAGNFLSSIKQIVITYRNPENNEGIRKLTRDVCNEWDELVQIENVFTNIVSIES